MSENELRVHDLAVSFTQMKWMTSKSSDYLGDTHPDRELADYLETYEDIYSKIMDIVNTVGFSQH